MSFFEKNKMQNFEKAKKIFYANSGSHFYMWQNGVIIEYEKYKVPKSIENMWINDIKNSILAKIKLSNNHQKVILVNSYVHLLDNISAIEFLINTLDEYCGDTLSFIILIENLKQFYNNANNDLKEKIESKIKKYKYEVLNKEIVIDDYYKTLSYMQDYDFSLEGIRERINKL